MSPIRVLIVDDSVVVRRLLSDLLSSDPELEVAGVASDGHSALAKIQASPPDLVTLDVEMPGLDGLKTLAAIRASQPKLPVIMFSALTERAARTTLEALSLGATDYVTKPSDVTSLAAALVQVREQLVPKIKALCALPKPRPRPLAVPFVTATPSLAAPTAAPLTPSLRAPAPLATAAPRVTGEVELVVIGSSTGGPNALATLLPRLPRSLSTPILITQHMPPVFTRQLAARLGALSGLEVREATGGEALTPGSVWIAPGDFHLVVRRDGQSVRLAVHQGPPENSCRPSVDVLFRSAAEVYGGRTLAVVLTGMGQDGLRGCQRIREAGGQVVVQDEVTSVVWGMPGFVARAGLANAVVPLDTIDAEITRRLKFGARGRAAPTVRKEAPHGD
jgi:two-component system chemotaxis response regulator CheB